MMKRLLPLALFCAVATLVACATTEPPGKPEYMVVGIDNKTKWGDDGKVQFTAPGKDLVTIVDIGTDPANPKIVASLPLMNSIFGPPTNLSITPNGQLALVANSMDWMQGRGLEARARQQALRHRPHDKPSEAPQYGNGRQATVWHVDQPCGQLGADRKSR